MGRCLDGIKKLATNFPSNNLTIQEVRQRDFPANFPTIPGSERKHDLTPLHLNRPTTDASYNTSHS